MGFELTTDLLRESDAQPHSTTLPLKVLIVCTFLVQYLRQEFCLSCT